MRKIRKNNDIFVEVSVKRDGYPEDLTGKDVILYMNVAYTNIPVKDFTVDGNVISFTFLASEQKYVGVYSLTIQVKTEDATNTVDKCNIFELVSTSCQISGEDEPNIKTESVSLELDVYLDAVGGGGGGEGTSDYNQLENKPKINGITLQGEKTLEALGIQPAGNYLTESDIPDLKGEKGEDGKDGYTPVKGVDYFTDADKKEIENEVIQSLEPKIPTKTSQLINDSGFITNEDISNLATKEELNNGLAEKQPKGDYALTSDIPSLTGYATEEWVNQQINTAINGLSEEITSINDLVGTDTGGGIA